MKRLRQLSDGLNAVLAWKNSHLRERTLLVRYIFMWCVGSIFAPFRFYLFENNRTEQMFVEDIDDGVSFNIDGIVANTVLSHNDHGTEFLREMCSSRVFGVAVRERVGMNRSQDSFDAFCLVEIHHQLRMHWHRHLISNSFDAACYVLNMKDGGWNLVRSSLTGSRSWRYCILTLNRTYIIIDDTLEYFTLT